MLSFIEGKIEYLSDRYVIVNAGGIGYRVNISPKLVLLLRKHGEEPLRLYLHSQLNMREGTFDLYGFEDRQGLDLFNLLISVNGIGPKNAMGILSTVEASHLKAAVVNEDAQYLKKVSGLGPKTAQRLILELKNKIDHIDTGDSSHINLVSEGQALEALLALGYGMIEAKDTLKEVKADSAEEKVRQALKLLGRK